jgi:hypothetical protein
MTRLSWTFGLAAAGVALAASVTSAPPGVAAPSPAPAVVRAGGVAFTGLSTGVLRVKDSHLKTLHLSVGANRGPRGTASVTVTLSTGTSYISGETHSWTFTLKRSAFSYSAGKAKLSTKTMLKSFGAINLAFAKRSQSKSPCHPSGSLTRVQGSVSGTVFLNTQTGRHGWGTVGSRAHKIRIKAGNFVTLLGTGCPLGSGGGVTGCVRGIFWSPPYVTGSTSSFFGLETSNGHAASTITVSNHVTLSSPAGATRNDDLVAKEPRPTFKAGVLHITTSGSTVTGSASITSSSHSPNPYSCKAGGKKRTEKTQDYSGTWIATSLVAHFGAIGAVSAPTSGTGTFTTKTY